VRSRTGKKNLWAGGGRVLSHFMECYSGRSGEGHYGEIET
jgi:hypothetical protein